MPLHFNGFSTIQIDFERVNWLSMKDAALRKGMAMYTLRPVTDADYDYIYELNSVTMRPYVEPIWGWDEDLQRQAFERRWNPDNQQIIIVEARNAGRLTLNETDELIYLAQINLLPEFQGKGIGSAVIESVKADAARQGKFVELRVLKTNRNAQRLYERLGFTMVDETDTHFWMRWYPPNLHRA